MEPQVVETLMETTQYYAEKSASFTLTEYEVLMYEQLCDTVTKYCKLQQLVLDHHIRKLTREDIEESAAHQKWLEDGGNASGGEATAA